MLDVLKEPYVSLFLIMFFGVLISKLQIKGIGLGSSGLILSAILFGYFDMRAPPSIEKIGLILFIFSIGIQAGPGFFDSFKTGEARQYLKSTITTLFITFSITILIGKIFGHNSFLLAGLFSGITTSTPAFAAIIENGKSTIPVAPYALAYPVALVTTIITIRLVTKFLNIDFEKEEADYKNQILNGRPKIETNYLVINNPNICKKSLKEINLSALSQAVISRIKRKDSNSSFIPSKETLLEEGDLIKIIGNEKSLETAQLMLGKKTKKEIQISEEETLSTVLVTNPKIIGKSLAQLNLNLLWGTEIREILRSGVRISPTGTTRLRFGDKILASVKKDSKPNFIKMLGGIESNSIDFLPISIAIVLGVIIGQISIPIGTTNIGPGMTGGILFTTLILGRIGKTGPMLWSIAGKTNQFLREIGIILFLCGVGSNTSISLIKSFSSGSIQIILLTILITILSILLTTLVSIKFFKLNRLRFLGTLAGSFTCSAALPESKEIKNSSIPLTAYSVTYPFSLLLTIIIGQLILLL